MTTFALIHGAWGSGWHWAGLPDELRALGHEAIACDLPCEDLEATFDDYAQVVLDALIGVAGDDVVVVGYSLGGNTAALVAARRPVRGLVYLGALVPEPGLSLNDQFSRGDRMLLPEYLLGIEIDREAGFSRWVDFDAYGATICHDCTDEVIRARFDRSRIQAAHPHRVPCSLDAHPAVPARYILCAEDRIMNLDYWRDAVPSRLGIEPEVIEGSHSPMAARPAELASLLARSA